LSLIPGWNLVGHSASAPLDVPGLFGNAEDVFSVWKWNAAYGKWAFYTPSLEDGGSAYAATKGYDALTVIQGGEGFWVSARRVLTVQLPGGIAISSVDFQDQLTPPNSLPSGWSLVAIGDSRTPRDFNIAVGTTPPAPGVIPANIISLWAWDSASSNWYFYAPSLDSAGTLAGFVASKGYLGFGSNVLTPTTGFWVYRP
jgi:hypothetical protein